VTDDMKCHMCGNTVGFVFGACVSCGFNQFSKKFDWIKVHVSNLRQPDRDKLVEAHLRRYRKCYHDEEEWNEIVKDAR